MGKLLKELEISTTRVDETRYNNNTHAVSQHNESSLSSSSSPMMIRINTNSRSPSRSNNMNNDGNRQSSILLLSSDNNSQQHSPAYGTRRRLQVSPTSNNNVKNNTGNSNDNSSNTSSPTTTTRRMKRRKRKSFYKQIMSTSSWIVILIISLFICIFFCTFFMFIIKNSYNTIAEQQPQHLRYIQQINNHNNTNNEHQVIRTNHKTTTTINSITKIIKQTKDMAVFSDEQHNDNGHSNNNNNIDHQHKIPNIVIFTHSINLLETKFNFTANDENITDEQKELIALQKNVKNIIQLHTNATIRFLTDNDCIQGIRNVLNYTQANELIEYFINEIHGMYKGDICRGIALYETGGLYFDVDLGVRMNIFDVLNITTEFATVKVHQQSKYPGNYFQAFLSSIPKHPVLYRYIQLFIQYYQGKLKNKIPDGPLGVLLLKRAYDEIQFEQQQNEIEKQRNNKNDDDDHDDETNTYKQTHLYQTTELWQEVLYIPEYTKSIFHHIPYPTWGIRRACKFIVLAAPTLPAIVPFYSRIEGSRMCPASTTTK